MNILCTFHISASGYGALFPASIFLLLRHAVILCNVQEILSIQSIFYLSIYTYIQIDDSW